MTQNMLITRSPLILVMADGGCFVERICDKTLKRENVVMKSYSLLCFIGFIGFIVASALVSNGALSDKLELESLLIDPESNPIVVVCSC